MIRRPRREPPRGNCFLGLSGFLRRSNICLSSAVQPAMPRPPPGAKAAASSSERADCFQHHPRLLNAHEQKRGRRRQPSMWATQSGYAWRWDNKDHQLSGINFRHSCDNKVQFAALNTISTLMLYIDSFLQVLDHCAFRPGCSPFISVLAASRRDGSSKCHRQ